jgi:hypothetical protein
VYTMGMYEIYGLADDQEGVGFILMSGKYLPS